MNLLVGLQRVNQSCELALQEGNNVSLDALVQFATATMKLAQEKGEAIKEQVAIASDFINSHMISERGCNKDLLNNFFQNQKDLLTTKIEEHIK